MREGAPEHPESIGDFPRLEQGGATLHGLAIPAELEAMQAAGIEPAELLVMATRNGARSMGREDIGTIRPGQVADIIICFQNPVQDVKNLRHITHVTQAGKLHLIEELARPLTSVFFARIPDRMANALH